MKKTTILIFLMFLLLSIASVAQDLETGFTGTAGMPDPGNNGSGRDVPQAAQITASSFFQPGTLAYLVAGLVSLGIYAKRKRKKRT